MKNFPSGEPSGQRAGNGAGNPVWRDVVMPSFTLFDHLTADLEALGRGASGRHALAHLVAIGVDLRDARSPLAVALSCQDGRDPVWAEATTAMLAARAPADPLCTQVVLVALAPQLRPLAARLVRRGVAPDESAAVVVASVLEALAAGAGDGSSPVTSGVLAETWRRARRVARRTERDARCQVPVARPPEPAPVELDIDEPAGDDSLLDQAVRTTVLSAAHAQLVYETRVLGRRASEVAAAWGWTPGALLSARRRAERRLRAMVADAQAAGDKERSR